jgi:hypothetical protein
VHKAAAWPPPAITCPPPQTCLAPSPLPPQINITWVREVLPYVNGTDPVVVGSLARAALPVVIKVCAAPACGPWSSRGRAPFPCRLSCRGPGGKRLPPRRRPRPPSSLRTRTPPAHHTHTAPPPSPKQTPTPVMISWIRLIAQVNPKTVGALVPALGAAKPATLVKLIDAVNGMDPDVVVGLANTLAMLSPQAWDALIQLASMSVPAINMIGAKLNRIPASPPAPQPFQSGGSGSKVFKLFG